MIYPLDIPENVLRDIEHAALQEKHTINEYVIGCIASDLSAFQENSEINKEISLLKSLSKQYNYTLIKIEKPS